MKYNVPFGLADETTLYSVPYVNGNPSTGAMGSIPPAASIEYDQREIVEVINYAYSHGYRDNTGMLCAAPNNGDLTQLRKAIWGFINSDKLALNLDYYVNQSGSDTANDGLSAGSPFATIQHAVDMSQKFDPNGFTITIHVADGNYGPFVCGGGGNLKGFGTVNFIGNIINPQNVIVTAPGGSANAMSFNGKSRSYLLGGFKIVSTGPLPTQGVGLFAGDNAVVKLYNVEFGVCNLYQLWSSNSYIFLAGMIDQISGVPWPFIHVSGGGVAHMRSSEGGAIGVHAPDLNILSPVAYSQGWTLADNLSHQVLVSDPLGSQPNFYNSITGKSNVTGMRYNVSMNSIINSGGGGSTYLPGTVAGVTSTGGQYL